MSTVTAGSHHNATCLIACYQRPRTFPDKAINHSARDTIRYSGLLKLIGDNVTVCVCVRVIFCCLHTIQILVV